MASAGTLDRTSASALTINTVLLPIALATTALFARLSVGPLIIDDAYITFRYARNVAEGIGFVYNPGEHVLGTTTPLYTLILSALYRVVGGDLPHLAVALNAIADAGTTILIFWLIQRLDLGPAWGSLACVLFALSPLMIGYAAGGMESSLFTFLVVGAAAADLGDNPAFAGLAAGLATLTRPEGILIGALILARHLIARRAPPASMVLALLLPVVPWLIFAFWWFGSPIPHSVVAKAVAYQNLPAFANGLWLLIYFGLPGSSPFQLLLANPPVPAPVGLVVSGVLLVLVTVRLPRLVRHLRQMPHAWPLTVFAPALATAYAVSGLKGVPMFQWYLVPLLPFFTIGIVALMRCITRPLPRLATILTAMLLVGWTALGLNLGRDVQRGPLAPLGVNLVREDAYAEAARLLGPRLTQQSLVALPEIGAFGYATRARILDTVGLVSPEATRYYPLPVGFTGENAVPSALIRDTWPDFIVGHDRYLQPPLLNAAWFRRDYRLVATIPARIWNGSQVLVYERTKAASDVEGGR